MAFNINTDSADWREIQRWAEQQIAECHARLERCTQIETPYFQGRIAQLRALLALTEKPKRIPSPTPLA